MSKEALQYGEYLKPVSEKGRNRWFKTLLWGSGSFIAFAALAQSLTVGVLGALLGGAYGYKRASSTS